MENGVQVTAIVPQIYVPFTAFLEMGLKVGCVVQSYESYI
jgi:hypothetical protein